MSLVLSRCTNTVHTVNLLRIPTNGRHSNLWEANWLVLFTMIEREVEVEDAVNKSSSWQDEKF